MRMIRLALALTLYIVTWDQFEAQAGYNGMMIEGDIVEVSRREMFDTRAAAIRFIDVRKGNRRMWNFRFYQCVEEKP